MKIIRDNPYFFSAFLLWLLWGAVWLLTNETGAGVLYWSARRSAIGDIFFKGVTLLGEGWTYAAVILGALFISYRNSLLIYAMSMVVMLTSYLSKLLFSQERPLAFLRRMNQLEEINFVEGVDVHSGATSFPSGHTMAAFALFALLAFLTRGKKAVAITFFLLALSVAISRVYLVQHFIKDVYAGSIIGLLLAMAVFAFARSRLSDDESRWYNRRIRVRN